MPLQSQLVEVDFGQGVDTKTDPEHLVSGKLRAGTNIRFPKDGSVDKRFGSVYLAAAGTTAKVACYRDEVLTFAPSGAASTYSPQKAAFVAQGQAMECVATRDHIMGSPNYAHDVAYGNGVEVYVWSDTKYLPTSGNVWYLVRDAVTGAEITAPTIVASGRHPRVCFFSSTNTFAIVWWFSGFIRGATISSVFALSGTTDMQIDNVTPLIGNAFEIASTASDLYLLYKNATEVTLKLYSTALAAVTSKSVQACDAAGAFGLQVTEGESVWCSYLYTTGGGATTNLDVSCFDEVSLVLRAGFPVVLATAATLDVKSTSVSRHALGEAVFLVGRGSDITARCDVPVVWSDATIKYALGTRVLYFTQPASKPFFANSRTYAWLYDGGARQDLQAGEVMQYSMVLVDLQGVTSSTTYTGRMACGPIAPRFSQPQDDGDIQATPPSVFSTSASVFATAGRILRSNSGRVGLARVNADFSHAGLWQSAELGEGLHSVPGTSYDSSSFVELGFSHYPEDINIVSVGAAGSMAAGSYWYVCCYEWIDGRGNVHRSATSTPRQATTAGATGSVVLGIPAISCTSKLVDGATGIKAQIYRTTVGGTSAGPFYQLTTVTTAPDMSFTAQFTNFTDTIADTSVGYSLAANATVYTTGGVLDNMQPPCSSAMVTHRNRVWLVSDDKKTVWFSKAYVEGEAVAFSDDFTVPIEDGVRLTAMASMDGNIVLFSRNRIYVLSGTEGPNDLGAGSDIGTPTKLAVDLGCIEPRSVVLTPGGLMFQSSAGIYVLSRGMEVSYVGQPIEDILALYPTITSAMVHPTNSCVYFTAQGSEYGARLVFDYRKMEWSWDELGTTTAAQGRKIAGEVALNGTVYTVTATGTMVREGVSTDAQAYLDEYVDATATWVAKSVELADVKLAGLLGFQRAWMTILKTKWYTGHELTLSIANDNSTTFHQNKTFSALATTNIPFELRLSRQLCRTVRLRVTDAAPSSGSIGNGRGAAFVGAAFDVGVESGPARIKAGHKG